MSNFEKLITVLNAALEHVPAQTRAILIAQAQEAIKAIEAEQPKPEAPAKE